MNDLFVSVEYNDREIDGIEEFKRTLNEEYLCQIRPKWIPACSAGAEFWMTIFVNSGVVDFLNAAIAGGIAWDLIKSGGKKYVFKPLFQALERLNQENLQNWSGLKVLKLKLQFDDCEIYIGGLNQNFTSVVSSLFNEISKKKPFFEREVGGLEVIRIELPIIHREHLSDDDHKQYVIDTFNDDYSIESFKKLWKITYVTDFPILIYDFKKDKLFDPRGKFFN